MLQRQELRKAGLKVTLPRLKILEILENSEPRHLSAEDIYRQLLETGEDIGLATVYRVLTQFEAAGLVTRHNFEGGHSVFEMDDGKHHDHMVCIESGEVVEFTNDEIERIQKDIAKSHGFELIDHNLLLIARSRPQHFCGMVPGARRNFDAAEHSCKFFNPFVIVQVRDRRLG
jgi:Fur family ferric uptake transcriptional regulator